jgi:His-Xaa-Ser system protein HxsD
MSQSEREADTISVTFDSQVYSLTAVKKAAYKYLDRFSADISIVDTKINCRLTSTSSNDQGRRQLLVEDFRKEVLDQDLRETLKVETEAVRNLILSYAFSKTTIPSDENIS